MNASVVIHAVTRGSSDGRGRAAWSGEREEARGRACTTRSGQQPRCLSRTWKLAAPKPDRRGSQCSPRCVWEMLWRSLPLDLPLVLRQRHSYPHSLMFLRIQRRGPPRSTPLLLQQRTLRTRPDTHTMPLRETASAWPHHFHPPRRTVSPAKGSLPADSAGLKTAQCLDGWRSLQLMCLVTSGLSLRTNPRATVQRFRRQRCDGVGTPWGQSPFEAPSRKAACTERKGRRAGT